MASKKNKPSRPQLLSPEKYIRTKARNLPLYESLVPERLFDDGQGLILISRQHASGNFTVGVYWVDVFCLGIKESLYHFNLTPGEYKDLKVSLCKDEEYKSVRYEEAHNIVYGALDYAEECGIRPAAGFAVTQYLLEEDTDDIPLLEYDFGKDGRPFLVVNDWLEFSKYESTLWEHVGTDFCYCIDGKIYEANEGIDEDKVGDFLLDHPSTPYLYQHPDYPQTLSLTHPELEQIFTGSERFLLSRKEIDTILNLPRESLIQDLQHLILHEIGLTCEGISEETWKGGNHLVIIHALFFLGELEAEEAFDTVLEVLRQNSDFLEYHFGDSVGEVLPLTLYKTGRNKLPELVAFAKEPGLYTFLRGTIFSLLTYIAKYEPERREEVIACAGEVLDFYLNNWDDEVFFDATLASMLIYELAAIHAKELLPQIKNLFDEDLVDVNLIGGYEKVESLILSKQNRLAEHLEILDIYTRYTRYHKFWF